ncbi:ATP-binding protein [Modicisalibacter xianhensis]|uniref:histidine kinase n=1 Tax=Modicisalibacter xianhensis TaxID=442341 RepID=A0A1I3BI95_9GAMM|nr:ATP-binding protein [Halomonas xianhensis]SFH61880.1 Na+/proline symporter [Halomonas xianhensis]
MSTSLTGLLALGVGYLVLLLLCAQAAERGWIPARLLHHPAVYTQALGVYASAWAIYGSVEFAADAGYGYLAYYLGVAGAFLLGPVMLLPIQRMTRTYQLASLADLFVFRFRSRWVGTLITLVTLLAVLPLLALQIQTLGEAVHLLTRAASPSLLALLFCLLIAGLALAFGARHTHQPARHEALIAVIAVESLVKLGAMLTLGGIALYGIFDGPADLQAWLDGPGLITQAQTRQLDSGQWRTLLLLFFAAAFLMPHMFHMVFTETPSRRALLQTSWSLPLFLLLMAVPIPLILWGAQRLGIDTTTPGIAYLAFALSDSPWVDTLVFLAGLAAASGTMILIALSLAGMILNHVVLVAHPPDNRPDLYRWLLWLRRALIVAVILSGWLFYRTIGIKHDLTTLGLAAFVGMAQCLPGMLAVLYWPGANRKGMVSGLAIGCTIWLLGLWLPLLAGYPALVVIPPGLESLEGTPGWYAITLLSLACNILVFILVSLMTRTSEGERAAAEACSVDAVIRPKRHSLAAKNGEDFKRHLAQALGPDVAEREVSTALEALGLSPLDGRPYALRRLRDRLQANLSGLMGPAVARDIVDRFLPYHQDLQATPDIHYVESRLEAYRSRLTGLARELDSLRRHHRRTLAELPVGLCAFGEDRELLMWNSALARLSGIAGESVIGAHCASLPAPWAELLSRMIDTGQPQLYKQAVRIGAELRYLSLHKATLAAHGDERGGTVILVEDHSEMKWLEDELVHAERLASIGRLAAGVAHEIGNPITGISSLAQNLRYDTDDPALLETAAQIQQLTERVSSIVSSLVSFAHSGRHLQGSHVERVDLHQLCEEALHLIRLARSGQDIRYSNRCPSGLEVDGNAQRLVQVLVNLIGNARDACQAGGHVEIDAQPHDDGIHMCVTDDGHGIDAAIRDHLFEPFTTTKAPGQGTGLGLPLVYNIVREHHGHIRIDSPPPDRTHGTRITVWLPRTQQDGEDSDAPDIDR